MQETEINTSFYGANGSFFNKALAAATLVIFLILLPACSSETDSNLKAAPIGDHSVLEELAEAYEKLAEHITTSPTRLPPKERKRFVDNVFKEAGYSYSATLRALVEQGIDVKNKNQMDLAELIRLPHRGLGGEIDPASVYGKAELADISTLERQIKKGTW